MIIREIYEIDFSNRWNDKLKELQRRLQDRWSINRCDSVNASITGNSYNTVRGILIYILEADFTSKQEYLNHKRNGYAVDQIIEDVKTHEPNENGALIPKNIIK